MQLSILIFLLVTLTLLGLFHFVPLFTKGDKATVRKRLAEEFRAKRPGDAARTLYNDLDVLNLSSAEEYALLGGMPQPVPRSSWRGLHKRLEQWLQEANCSWPANHILIVATAGALGLGLAGGWWLGWIAGLAGFLAGAAFPFVVLHGKRKARRQQLLKQLPNAFTLMARVIRAGQSVPQAFQAVGEAFEEPLAGEFTRCQQQQSLGLPPDVVFQELARRSGILELRLFVMAMSIQRLAGGNLSEVLERLAGLIRERLRLRQQVRTLTAEGRLQGLTLVILPVVMFAAMFVINRPYAEVLLHHPGLLWATGAFMAMGVLWIRKIVNFEG